MSSLLELKSAPIGRFPIGLVPIGSHNSYRSRFLATDDLTVNVVDAAMQQVALR